MRRLLLVSLASLARLAPLAPLLAALACAPPPQAPPPSASPAVPAPAPAPAPPLLPPPPAPAPLPATAPDTPAEHALAQLFADAWEDRMRESPVFASILGDRRYNDQWGEETEAAFARRAAHAAEFLARARAIAPADLYPPSQLNRTLFERDYALEVEGYEYAIDAPGGGANLYIPMTPQGGIQDAGDIALQLRFTTAKDYEDWLRRMETFPALVDQVMTILREGMKRKLLYPRVAMQRVTAQLDRQIVPSPEQSPFYKPFTRFPPSIGDAERSRMSAAAKRAISTRIIPAYQTLRAFYTKEYLPACYDQVGIGQLPRGDETYAFLARLHTTTTRTPQEIHDLGVAEVARIHGEMQALMEKTGFKGTLKDFFVKLRTDPRFFYKNPDDLLEAYRATAKKIDPLLVKLFKTLPRTPYGVEPIPPSLAPDATTAYYFGPAEDGSRAGTYFVNLYKPESRPIWEMTALTMHESVPGHHLQLALAQEHGDLPQFRRNGGYTAFVEGWGLYAESLGDEVGLYDDPYAKMGQLAYEMWRAVRLVIDTGMHVMKWDRQKAIDFFLENDPKASLDVTNEVDRYLVMPGQALAYEIGALKIKELRARAAAELGARFDVREFHDAVLEEGSVPLDVLEAHIASWIASRKGPAAAPAAP